MLRRPNLRIKSLTLLVGGLGLTIGMGAGVVAVTERIVRDPVAGADLNRVVVISGLSSPPGEDAVSFWSSVQSWRYLARYWAATAVLDRERGERVRVAAVSSDFLRVLSVAPHIGRDFRPEESRPAADSVALISYSFLRSRFGGADPLGSKIHLNGIEHTVVGVLADGFTYPEGTQVWVPVVAGRPRLGPSFGLGEVGTAWSVWIAKLATSPETALADAQGKLAELNAAYANTSRRFGELVTITTIREHLAKPFRPLAPVFLITVAAGLLLACANAVLLLLGTTVARRRDTSVRLALGATRSRIVGALLLDGLQLCIACAALAWSVSWLSLNLLRSSLVSLLPGLAGVTAFSPLVVAFCLGCSAVAILIAVGVCVIDVIRSASQDLLRDIRTPQHSLGRPMFRRLLVVTEVALACGLVSVSVVALRVYSGLLATSPGFRPSGALTAQADFGTTGLDNAGLASAQEALTAAAATIPGFSSVGLSNELPLTSVSGHQYIIHRELSVKARCFAVAGDYFTAMGIPLTSGRPLQATDRKAIVVNGFLARSLWPGASPIGDQLLIDGENQPRQVIGVAADVRDKALTESPEGQVYVPLLAPYRDRVTPSLHVVGRCIATCGPAEEFRDVLSKTFPGASFSKARPLSQLLEDHLVRTRLQAGLLVTYSLIGLGIACVGAFGVVSHMARTRRYEAAIHMVAGASPAEIASLVLFEVVCCASAGVLVGSLLGVAFGRIIESVGAAPVRFDPVAFTGSAVLILAATVLAAIGPASSLALTNPSAALTET